MPAGFDEGSPAKKYADAYHKARKEIVARFRELVIIAQTEWPDPEVDAAVQAKADMYGLTIDNLIQ